MKKGIVIAMGDDVFTENPRITVHHSLTLDGEQAWVLTIKNVNMDDTGDYMCSLNTNTNLRKLYHLSVVVPPKIVDADTSSDVEVKEGERVLLHCGASGKPDPSYKWRREDSSLIHTSGKTELMVVGRELVIPKALKEHAGAYLCIATNGVPPSVSKRILLTVRFRPLIQASASEVWVNLGSCVNLSCVVDAFPEPNMVWLKDLGEPITTAHRSDYHLHDSSATQVQKHVTGLLYVNSSRWIMTLTVEDVHEGDLLGYRCRANNSEGVAEARVVIYSKLQSYGVQ
ncbi:lachesin-like [Homarus americanus]|uniref:lachesin-like n=1 Tax=Homarus americanus TaxID=6706 RepID=UPI001C441E14|nr:lachesin-like [Homarus americanus]